MQINIKVVLDAVVSAGQRAVSAALHGISSLAGRVGQSFAALRSSIVGAFTDPIGTMWRFKNQLIAIAGTFAIVGKAIRGSFRRETIETQFATMLGSLDKPKGLIPLLRNFSVIRPFTETLVLNAS